MNINYASLLRLMAIKYNDLANTTSIATSPPTFDSDTNNDYMIDCQCSCDAEEIDGTRCDRNGNDCASEYLLEEAF